MGHYTICARRVKWFEQMATEELKLSQMQNNFIPRSNYSRILQVAHNYMDQNQRRHPNRFLQN